MEIVVIKKEVLDCNNYMAPLRKESEMKMASRVAMVYPVSNLL